MVINIRSLLQRAARFQSESLSVYLFDTTLTSLVEGATPEFLSGIEIRVSEANLDSKDIFVFPETEYAVLQDFDLYFEHDMHIGGRIWTIVVVPVEGTYEPRLTFIILSGSLIFAASVLLAIWMLHNMRRSIQMHRVITQAAAEASIVSNLFPANVRERMIHDAETKNMSKMEKAKAKDIFVNDGKRSLNKLLTSEGIFGSKPIAELHPYTTVM